MIEVKQIGEEDWNTLKEIRLKALASDPAVFGSSFDHEAKMSEADWRSWLVTADTGIFVVILDSKPVGMTAISIDRHDPTKQRAMLWGSWLPRDLRNRGLSKLLYMSRIQWTERHPNCLKIVVSHRESNLSSRHANQKHGFRWIRSKQKTWNDGAVENEHFYELDVKLGTSTPRPEDGV